MTTTAHPPDPRGPVWPWLAIVVFAVSLAILLAAAQGCSPRRHHLNLPKHERSS